MTRWQIVILAIGVAYALLRASLRWRYRRRGCAAGDAMLERMRAGKDNN